MTELTPEERAVAAAETLDADGNPVTARAVRDLARIDMNLASRVAREWNAQQAQARDVPPIPDAVMTRVNALWREAIEAAHAEHKVEVDGWLARVKHAEDERDAAMEDAESEHARFEEAQARAARSLDDAEARIAELEAAAQQHASVLAEAQARAVNAETRAAAAEGIAAGLREALEALSPKKA